MNSIPFEPGKFYHVFNRGNNRENLFREEKNYAFFLRKLFQNILTVADIYAYCFLPNHFHLVIRIKEMEYLPEDYRKGIKKIHQPFSNFFNCYSKSTNKTYNRTGSLFQEHLHRNEIKDERYLKNVIIYVHLNPVNHGFNKDFDRFTHSSFRELTTSEHTSLQKDEVIEWFGGMENFLFCHRMKRMKDLTGLQDLLDLDLSDL
jgi:putative transposase